MGDQLHSKMEPTSSVVAPDFPRKTFRLQPMQQRQHSGGSNDGTQPPSAPPPPPALGEIWGVVPPLFPPDKPPPPYGAPGKAPLERVGLDPKGESRDATNSTVEEVQPENEIDGKKSVADQPRDPCRANSEPEEEDAHLCCAGGCCGESANEHMLGPMAKPRKCRDVACLALFLLVWVGWIGMLWVVYTEGCPDNCNDPRKLIFGTDSTTGEVCGSGSQAGKVRVYHSFPANPLSRRFCVAECPSAFSSDADSSIAMGLFEGDAHSISNRDNCLLHDVAGSASNHSRACYYPTYAAADLLFKCIPLIPRNLSQASALGFPASPESYAVVSKFMAAPVGWLGDVASELQVTWRVTAAASGVAVALGFAWLLLLKQFALCTVVTFGFLLLAASSAVTLLAWDKAGVVSVVSVAGDLDDSLESVNVSSTLAKIIAGGLSLLTLVLLLLALCFTRRVLVAVRLFREASAAVLDMPSLILFPLSTLLAALLLAAIAVTGGLYLASAGEYDPVLGTYSYASTRAVRDSACPDSVLASNPLPLPSRNASYEMSLAEAERWCVVFRGDADEAVRGWRVSTESRVAAAGEGLNLTAVATGPASMTVKEWLGGGFRESLPFAVADYYQYMWLYHVLCMLWSYCFTTTCMAMVTGGAVGDWFWRRDDAPPPSWAVPRSLLRLVCYQLGTAAMGGLVVAVVWFARLAVQSVLKRLRALSRGAPVVGVLGCLLDCCLKCIERFVKFINRNTAIVAALHGDSYCSSARRAFRLLLSNVLRVAAVTTTGLLLLLLGKLFVVAAAVTTAWAWIRYDPLDQYLLLANRTPVATLVVVAVLSWAVARLFMNVYWVVVEALLLCFFEDCESDEPLPKTKAIQGRMQDAKVLIDDDGQRYPRDDWRRKRDGSSRRNL